MKRIKRVNRNLYTFKDPGPPGTTAGLSARCLFDEARYCEETGDTVLAQHLYGQVAEMDICPYNVWAFHNLGTIDERHGRKESAEANYCQALAINPHYPRAHESLGSLLQDAGKINDAINHYLASLASLPNNGDAHFNLARAYSSINKPKKAIEHYRLYLRYSGAGQGEAYWRMRAQEAQDRLKIKVIHLIDSRAG